MSDVSPFSERLQRALTPIDGSVIGLVDRLLGACQEQGVQLDWHANQCRILLHSAERQDSFCVPLPKSVFRAALARVAALCNEQSPNSVSPYGGQGEVAFGPNSRAIFRVAFTNTPGEQRLELTPIRPEAVNGEARAEQDNGLNRPRHEIKSGSDGESDGDHVSQGDRPTRSGR
jgi:hypothetical protein